MHNLHQIFCVCTLLIICRVQFGESYISSNQEWNDYKTSFSKNYPDLGITERTARANYNYNMYLITNHNRYYALKRRSYGLKANQFSDMRWTDLIKLFPTTTQPTETSASPLPPPSNIAAPTSFDPRQELGLITTVQNQGQTCNAGWAYSPATAISYRQAYEAASLSSSVLSAQNLIDCAGSGKGCSKQIPQQAFDYLVKYGQPLRLEESYNNNNSLAEQGMCIPETNNVIFLNEYATIPNGDDATMKNLVANNYPVVVEFDPTSFDFLHYAEGVFTPPNSYGGSHFMTVIGYGRDTEIGEDFWLVQNSFDDTWGEKGFIRIAQKWGRSGSLTKSAILPI